MTGSATPLDGAAAVGAFDRADLFLADTRLAFLFLNEGRHRVVHRVFGVSRENENLLTLVLALSATSAALEGARRLTRPIRVSGEQVGVGAIAVRQAGMVVGGPTVGATPMFGALVAFALVTRVAIPKVESAARAARAAEQRVRQHRIARYLATSA